MWAVKDLIYQLKQLNNDLKLPEIEGILYLIMEKKADSSNDLVRLTGLPKETIRNFVSSISNKLSDGNKEKLQFNDDFKSLLSELNLQPFKWSLVNNYQEDLVEKFKDIRKKYKLEPKREFDQFFATTESSLKKAQILKDKGLIKSKHIVILGDDDLVSVAIPMLDDSYSSITVLEIDPDLINTLEKIVLEQGYKNIKIKEADFRNPLDNSLRSRFDVAIMDPPYTPNGIRAFLNTGVELLKPAISFDSPYIVMFYGNSFKSPEKTLKIQEIINKFGLLIEDTISKFISYDGAESIGSSSSAYILKASKHTHALGATVGAIYTYENTKEDRFPFVDNVVFKLYDVPSKIVTSQKELNLKMVKFCSTHKLKIVDTRIVQFKGQGHTLNYTLSNSVLSVHTWPELNAIHVLVAACSPISQKEYMSSSLSRLFLTEKIETIIVE